ncbi:hypothetical protein SLA2020_326630 [Shorea laevis]
MASSSLSLYLVGFLAILAGGVMGLQGKTEETGEMVMMEEEELLGLFEVMGSLLDEPGWAEVHQEPCTNTPWPGVGCEVGEEDPPIFHVTLIHVGPDVANPPCKSSAKLSDSLLKLPYLKTLSIFNCFVASPVSLSRSLFGALSSLEHLSLQSNPSLFGEIPPGLSSLKDLRVLSLSQNNIQGNIPSELGGLVKLEQFDLSYNNLSGEIPEEIGGLESLSILDLSWNAIEGEVPSYLGQLQLLQKVDLCSNRLHGKIAPELGNLNRLVLLDLSHNFINGPIPETFSGLEQLQYLILDQNPINSHIPFFLGTLKKLVSISFSGCGLTGTIPNFSLLKNLTALSLDNNNLSGTVPPNLGSLPNLDHLNLSNNKLRGELVFPDEFIYRLGERLDVRGNEGLCTCNQQYNKNVSAYLQTPVCFGTEGIGENRTCPKQQHPDDSKGINSFLYHGKISSDSPLQDSQLMSANFGLCFLSSIVTLVSSFCFYYV